MTIPSGRRRRTGCGGNCTAFGEFGHAHGVRAARGDGGRFTYTRSPGHVSGQCGRTSRGTDRSGERSQKQKAGAVVTRSRDLGSVSQTMDDPSACLVSTREGEKGVRPPRSVHRLCLSRSHHFSHIPGNSHSFLALYSLATLRQSTSIPLATRRNNVTSTPFSYPAPRKYKPDNPGIFTLPTSSHYRHPLDIIDSHAFRFAAQH
jgi:hypothetical protein